jgi:CRISPR-associated protein Cmr1
MNKKRIECKLITPMLMHGEDTQVAELRPPSIKGAMRFWWRAIHGNLKLDDLKKQESMLFGGASENSALKSSFRIFIKKQNLQTIKNIDFYNSLTIGNKYNLYSLVINKDAKLFEKGNFELLVNFVREFCDDKREVKCEDEIINTLNYINFFGNLGARSRRGAGSIKFKHEKLLSFNGASKEELKNFISKNFKKISNNNYSIFAKKIFIFEPKNDWQKALESISNPFKDFRDKNKHKVFETPNFGFPIRHKDRSIFLGGKEVEDRGKKKCLSIERRSSPLIFKIYQSDNGKFFPMIIWLNGELLPDNYEIIRKKDCSKTNAPNEQIIEDFFNSLQGDRYVQW